MGRGNERLHGGDKMFLCKSNILSINRNNLFHYLLPRCSETEAIPLQFPSSTNVIILPELNNLVSQLLLLWHVFTAQKTNFNCCASSCNLLAVGWLQIFLDKPHYIKKLATYRFLPGTSCQYPCPLLNPTAAAYSLALVVLALKRK